MFEIILGLSLVAVFVGIMYSKLPDCPKCGIWFACEECSKEMARVDQEFEREGK